MKTKSKISGYIVRSAMIAVLFSITLVGFSSVVNSPNRIARAVIPSKVEEFRDTVLDSITRAPDFALDDIYKLPTISGGTPPNPHEAREYDTAAPTSPTPTPTGIIAFASDRDGNSQIYVMNVDGSDQMRLSNNSYNDSDPSSSAGGGKIAFVSDRDGNSQIYVMNADGSNQTRLSNNSYDDSEPSFSCDGSKIAFVSDRDGASPEIYVMNADGSNQIRLTDQYIAVSPSFNSDGSKIAFVAYCCDPLHDFHLSVYVMNADGSDPILLAHDGLAYYRDPSLSGDGNKITFVGGVDEAEAQIYVMDVCGSNQARLTNTLPNYSPSFSGDNSIIAFTSIRDGNSQIYVMNADGSNQTNKSNNSYNDSEPSFSGCPPSPQQRNATGLTINLTYDPDCAFAAAQLSPQDITDMKAACEYARLQVMSNFSDPINVNIHVTAVAGTGIKGGNTPTFAPFDYIYDTLRTAVMNDRPQTADDRVALALGGSVPMADPISTSHFYTLTKAQGKALQLLIDDVTPGGDGTFTFGGGWPWTYDPLHRAVSMKYDFIAVAMHEFTEIMGRIGLMGLVQNQNHYYALMDLFHYYSAGRRRLNNGSGRFFSIDNGTTPLNAFNDASLNGGDLQDWAVGTNDCFNERIDPGIQYDLTTVDLRVMDVIGYNRVRGMPTPVPRPTPPPHITPVPPPPSPRPTPWPRPTPPPHITPVPPPSSPRPTPAPRP